VRTMPVASLSRTSAATAQSGPSRLREPRPGRPRIALMMVLIAAAMPVRIYGSFPVVGSVSVLDIVLVLAAGTLFLDLAFRPVDRGYPELFCLLCIPLGVSAMSIAWSQDPSASVRTWLTYAEGMVAYLFVVRELDGVAPARIIRYISRYAYLLIVPAVLLILHVPGFGPQERDLSPLSGDYISYYTQLSHPVLGRSNNLATVLAFLAPLLLYWGHTRRDRRITLAGFITLLAIFLTLSRGVLLAFVVAGLLYAPFAVGRRRIGQRSIAGKMMAGVALGAVAIGVFYSFNPATNEFIDNRLSGANISARSEFVSAAWSKVADRPLLGYGAGATPDRDTLLEAGVHNTYLQQVLYFGLPLGLVVSATLVGIAAVFLTRRRSTALAGVIAYAVIVQLVIGLFEASFEGTTLRVLFYLSVGLATALALAAESESRPTWSGRAPPASGLATRRVRDTGRTGVSVIHAGKRPTGEASRPTSAARPARRPRR
jgi:O-antigen ligase